MRPRVIGQRIIRRQTVASTMDEIAALAQNGEPEGTVVVAETQTAGRGRGGREWQAPPGTGVLCSILLRPTVPASRLGTLALVVGVTVAEAIEAETGQRCQLKWPNDVWLDERKVAGILIATRFEADRWPWVTVGIGINVNLPASSLPEGATSLLVATGQSHDRSRLLEHLLDGFETAYAAFVAGDGIADLAGWRRRAALVGERVSVITAEATRSGILRDVDDDGALLLETANGGRERIVTGDLVRGPRRQPASAVPADRGDGP